MCLTVSTKTGVLRRAAHHILVFKALRLKYWRDDTLESPYQGTTYKLGEMRIAKIGFDSPKHTFMTRGNGMRPALRIGPGLHSYRFNAPETHSYGDKRYPALIPKGAYFIIGQGRPRDRQDIVSTHLFLLPEKTPLKRFKRLTNVTQHPVMFRLEDGAHLHFLVY